jgi:site-specific DNA recombinase
LKTAACYIRVSTDDQLEFSPYSQLKVIAEYAEKNDIILLENCIFTEDGGKSGKSMAKRDKFLELIALSKKKPKPFDVILVWKYSRFARNQEEAITLKSMLKKNDIDVISVSEPLPEGPFGDLIQRIVEWTDEYYLVNLAQEVRRGMKERAERGLPVTPPPVGYIMQDGKYIPGPDAPLVKNIFTDYLNGVGLRALAVKYSNLGLRTKRGNPIDNRCVEYMLRNPVYAGKIRWSLNGRAASTRHYDSPDIIVSNGIHEPIVTEELFNSVQNKLDEQKKMYGKWQRREQPISYMLKGLVRCSSCGSTLVLVNTKSPSLQCHSYGRGTCRVSHSITIARANEIFISYFENVIITEEINIVSSDGSPRYDLPISDYKRLIENEKAKLIRIKTAYENGIDTIDEYRIAKAKIQETIKTLEKSAAENKPKFNKKSYIKKLIGVLKIIQDNKQPEEAKNAALRTVIQKIVFNKPTNSFEVYFY